VEFEEFQASMRRTYLARDASRGVDATFRWLVEEIGELAKAIRGGDRSEIAYEFGDVTAWLASLANQMAVDLSTAVGHYADGCPKCGQQPCACPMTA
jgi:NTP pyrophosphatase (non-canonical NTP hydrolase)